MQRAGPALPQNVEQRHWLVALLRVAAQVWWCIWRAMTKQPVKYF